MDITEDFPGVLQEEKQLSLEDQKALVLHYNAAAMVANAARAELTERDETIRSLREALEKIRDFSDIEMGDGDGAREVAREALGAKQP